ncbi:VOC family protein [Nonomuraea sp. NPDC059194]|uniref:VOC family protein n=1 Tax=Nonomuraea sp. NPDC059194 TaxID=3346764 RepID=UPI0036BF12A9
MKRTVFALARYQDVLAAAEFLSSAFGFVPHQVMDIHAEMLVGDDMIMLGQGKPGGPGVYVAVDDPDAHHDKAVAAGAVVTMELVDQPYGSREYGCKDPEGNLWFFGTYRP